MASSGSLIFPLRNLLKLRLLHLFQ